MVTRAGLEGGGIYAHRGADARGHRRQGEAILQIDLRPDLTRRCPGGAAAGAARQAVALDVPAQVREPGAGRDRPVARGTDGPPAHLPASTPAALAAPDQAGAGPAGRRRADRQGHFDRRRHRLRRNRRRFMLRQRPGVFVAGEMLDWEAPTGGYLLQASFATGVAAADGCARAGSARRITFRTAAGQARGLASRRIRLPSRRVPLLFGAVAFP